MIKEIVRVVRSYTAHVAYKCFPRLQTSMQALSHRSKEKRRQQEVRDEHNLQEKGLCRRLRFPAAVNGADSMNEAGV